MLISIINLMPNFFKPGQEKPLPNLHELDTHVNNKKQPANNNPSFMSSEKFVTLLKNTSDFSEMLHSSTPMNNLHSFAETISITNGSDSIMWLRNDPGTTGGIQYQINNNVGVTAWTTITSFPCYIENLGYLWMIDDFTIENGATRIVPGSHTRPFFPENGKSYTDEISMTAPAGSVLLYNGALWHGGGPKQSDKDRWACIFSYARWYLKPSFDFNRNMPYDIFDKLSDECRELFGYKVNPPIDEFTRLSTRSEVFESPKQYNLPISSK